MVKAPLSRIALHNNSRFYFVPPSTLRIVGEKVIPRIKKIRDSPVNQPVQALGRNQRKNGESFYLLLIVHYPESHLKFSLTNFLIPNSDSVLFSKNETCAKVKGLWHYTQTV